VIVGGMIRHSFHSNRRYLVRVVLATHNSVEDEAVDETSHHDVDNLGVEVLP
jgi:hypothetical protein